MVNTVEPTGGDSEFKVLHLLLEVSEEEFPYNELCLARLESQSIAICSFFPSKVRVPAEVQLFEGDGSVRGFLRALQESQSSAKYEVIHAHSPHVACFLLLHFLTSRRERPPTVFTVHHSYTNSNLKTRNRLFDLIAFAAFDRVVVVSEAARESFPAAYRWLAGRRLRVVPNGADLDRLDRCLTRLGERIDRKIFTVVCVGRLIPIKNPLAVLEAFLRLRRGCRSAAVKLVFVGEGELGRSVEQRAFELEVSRDIELTGLVSREGVYAALANADLFVSASGGEGMPVSVLEAMACRCPVLLSDISPHREIAVGTDFIPLFPPDDVDALAEQMFKFRELRNVERREIGERCRQLVETRYSLPIVHSRYDEIYLELVRRG